MNKFSKNRLQKLKDLMDESTKAYLEASPDYPRVVLMFKPLGKFPNVLENSQEKDLGLLDYSDIIYENDLKCPRIYKGNPTPWGASYLDVSTLLYAGLEYLNGVNPEILQTQIDIEELGISAESALNETKQNLKTLSKIAKLNYNSHAKGVVTELIKGIKDIIPLVTWYGSASNRYYGYDWFHDLLDMECLVCYNISHKFDHAEDLDFWRAQLKQYRNTYRDKPVQIMIRANRHWITDPLNPDFWLTKDEFISTVKFMKQNMTDKDQLVLWEGFTDDNHALLYERYYKNIIHPTFIKEFFSDV